MSLEQFALLGVNVGKMFCKKFAEILSNRIPVNSSSACRIVQLFSKIFSTYSLATIGPLYDALKPFKNAILSQSFNRMFAIINKALDDPLLRNPAIEKVFFSSFFLLNILFCYYC